MEPLALGWTLAALAAGIGVWVDRARRLERRERLALQAHCAGLDERVRGLRQEADAARTESEARMLFVANMSHELRTPLNGVIGMTDLLAGTALDPEQRDCVDTIQTSAQALLGTINDVLDTSRLQHGHVKLDLHPVSPAEIVEEAAHMLAPRAAKKGVELLCEVDLDVPPTVESDGLRLRQILLNLVANAVKFTERGEVVLRVRRIEPDRLRFVVQDTGIGMSESQIAGLFRPFAQADGSIQRRFGGTGLGLWIAKSLCELLGGALWCESSPGKGSIFYAEVQAMPLDQTLNDLEVRAVDVLQGKKVLVVDDHPINRKVLSKRLEAWGMETIVCASGLEALHRCQQVRPDVALLDHNMPGMDGSMLAARLVDADPDLRILMASSAGDGADLACVRQVLMKPLREKRLLLALADAFTPMDPSTASLDVLPPGRPRRVLVADDNPINRKVAERMLRRLGCEPSFAEDGADVLRILEAESFDVILMDVHMPGVDGLEATRRLRALNLVPRPWVVALTADAMEQTRVTCMEAGMDDYTTKPLDQSALRAALSRFDAHAPSQDVTVRGTDLATLGARGPQPFRAVGRDQAG